MSSTHIAAARRSRVLICIGLFFYTWLFAEIFFRIFNPQPIMPRYVTGTEWGVRGNIPNARYWHRTPEADVQYRINGEGMRADRDYPLEKPSGTCRIALFGDSYFMGYELDLEDTFAYQLEKRLKEAGIHAEVLNFSVSGFGTAEMIKAYEGFGRRFDPDIVIFEWDEISPDNNVRSDLFQVSNGLLRRAAPTYLPAIRVQDLLMKSAIYRFVADNSQVYTFIRERVAGIVQDVLLRVQALANRTAAGAQSASIDDYPTLLSGLLLQYANETISNENREFVVVEIPRRMSRVSFESALDLLPVQTREQVKVLSPIATFRSAANPDTKLYFEKGHGHLTARGVELLLDSVEGPIQRSHSLNACRTNPN
jgi:hypothetical protein